MFTENIDNLSLPELIDLLSKTTLELLNAMQKGADEIMIRDKRKDVLLIQSVISTKKSANNLMAPKAVFLVPLILN